MQTSIVEYVERIGADSINFQLLASAMSNIVLTKREGSKITFNTDAITPSNVMGNTGPVGIILWIERDAFDRVTKEIDAKKVEYEPIDMGGVDMMPLQGDVS